MEKKAKMVASILNMLNMSGVVSQNPTVSLHQ